MYPRASRSIRGLHATRGHELEEYSQKFPVAAASPDHSSIAVVRKFVEAFNRQDVSAMLAMSTHDVRWMSVDGDDVSVETRGASELREAMQQYFENRSSILSRLLDINANGPFVTTLEQAGSQDHAGQCSTAVYEFSGNLIRNVWYYPAHDCDESGSD